MAHPPTRPTPYRTRFRAALSLAAIGFALTGSATARADRFPAPTEVLRDFDGSGYMSVDVPPTGTEPDQAGMKLTFAMRQQFLRPERLMIDIEMQGTAGGLRSRSLIQGNTERTFSPATGVVIERVYRNADAAAEEPIAARRMSLAALGQAFRTIESGKLLPPETIEEMEKRVEARIKELAGLRMLLKQSKNPEDIERSEGAAVEAARLRDLADQRTVFKDYPCYHMEIPNRDVAATLISRGLMGENARQLLEKGVTHLWVTRAEGLPVRLETTLPDGRVILYVCLKQLRINFGLQTGEVILGNPLGTPVVSVVADCRQKDWEEKLSEDLAKEIEKRSKRPGADKVPLLYERPVKPKKKP